VAIYRDGSKRSQPLSTKKGGETGGEKAETTTLQKRVQDLEAEIARLHEQVGKPIRRRMSDTRTAITHKFDIAGHEGYLTVGLFENGHPGELFITMAKEGSTIGGLMDTIGTLTSLALQYGVPLETLVKKFAHQRFEPSGYTKNPEVRNAASIIDYVFRWLAVGRAQPELPIPGLMEEVKKKVNRPVPELPIAEDADVVDVKTAGTTNGDHANTSGTGRVIASLSESVAHFQQDAPTCPNCGHVTVRNGACHKCLNCGESLGCS
jgi:ribonucleoside-diphosphate reductase alpha chain